MRDVSDREGGVKERREDGGERRGRGGRGGGGGVEDKEND